MPPAPDARTLSLLAWSLIGAGFLSGAVLGLRFHRDDFLGGYGSFRRRLLRLGHIACVALGFLSLQLLDTLAAHAVSAPVWIAPVFLAGAVLMPATCFLTTWRPPFRHLFALPVALLVTPTVALLFSLASAPSLGAER
jgi:hypothetical protein